MKINSIQDFWIYKIFKIKKNSVAQSILSFNLNPYLNIPLVFKYGARLKFNLINRKTTQMKLPNISILKCQTFSI